MQFAAADNGLPIEFYARLIRRESRLRPDAIEPVTRVGGRGALSARSFRSDSGAAEIGRVATPVPRPIRQFRAGGCGLQTVASTRSRLACWKTDIAVGDVGLCSHRHQSLR